MASRLFWRPVLHLAEGYLLREEIGRLKIGCKFVLTIKSISRSLDPQMDEEHSPVAVWQEKFRASLFAEENGRA